MEKRKVKATYHHRQAFPSPSWVHLQSSSSLTTCSWTLSIYLLSFSENSPNLQQGAPFRICASYTQQQLQHSHPLSQFGIRRTWLRVVIIALIIWCRCLIFKCVGTTAAADRLGVYEGNTWVILSFLETQVGTFFEREPRMITCLLSTWMLSGSWHCRSQTASPFKKTRVYRQVVERWTC